MAFIFNVFFATIKKKTIYSFLTLKKNIIYFFLLYAYLKKWKLLPFLLLPVFQLIILISDFNVRSMQNYITFSQYFYSGYMRFLTTNKLIDLRKAYYTDALGHFSTSLQYFFFKNSLTFFNKFIYHKRSYEKRVIYRKDLSNLLDKPFFIRNFTRLPNKNFWKIFKSYYKEPRVYKISYRKYSKKVLRFTRVSRFLHEYFILPFFSGFLIKYSISKLNWGLLQATRLYLCFKRHYLLKSFLYIGFKRNRIKSLLQKFQYRLDFFISLHLKISIIQARLLIKQKLFSVNGACNLRSSYILKPLDIVHIRNNSGFLALYALTSYSNYAVYKKQFKVNSFFEFSKFHSLPFWVKRSFFMFQNYYFYQINGSLFGDSLLIAANTVNNYKYQEGISIRQQFNTNFMNLNIFYKIFRKKRQLARVCLSYSLLQKWDSFS